MSAPIPEKLGHDGLTSEERIERMIQPIPADSPYIKIAALEDALRRIRDVTAIDVGHGNITAHNIAREALAATEAK
jgi:hypothetical protein